MVTGRLIAPNNLVEVHAVGEPRKEGGTALERVASSFEGTRAAARVV